MRNNRLVWIDLEMTGLDPAVDTILEIAMIITDFDLNIIHEGPDLVVYHPEEVLENMNDWCKEHHGKSGLTQRVRESTTTMEQAQDEIMKALKQNCLPRNALIAGNTVWQDRAFLAKYMPKITNFLHYQIIDVTSFKVALERWNDLYRIFSKNCTHRAMDDIKESIAEFKFYKDNFIKIDPEHFKQLHAEINGQNNPESSDCTDTDNENS